MTTQPVSGRRLVVGGRCSARGHGIVSEADIAYDSRRRRQCRQCVLARQGPRPPIQWSDPFVPLLRAHGERVMLGACSTCGGAVEEMRDEWGWRTRCVTCGRGRELAAPNGQ